MGAQELLRFLTHYTLTPGYVAAFLPRDLRGLRVPKPEVLERPYLGVDQAARVHAAYADLLFYVPDALLARIDFTRSAADAPSTESP